MVGWCHTYIHIHAVLLVFGATGGIGSALCERLARVYGTTPGGGQKQGAAAGGGSAGRGSSAGGATLVLSSNEGERLQALAQQVGAADVHVVDATQPDQVS